MEHETTRRAAIWPNYCVFCSLKIDIFGFIAGKHVWNYLTPAGCIKIAYLTFYHGVLMCHQRF